MRLQLPQRETDERRRERQDRLEALRADYRYEAVAGLPAHVKTLPARERFGADKQLHMFDDLARVAIELGLKDAAGTVQALFARSSKLDHFDKLYPGRDRPLTSLDGRWRLDEEFGRQRLAGVNPVLIRRCTAIPDHFPVTEAVVEGLIDGGQSLAAALDAGRIYLLDHAILDGVPTRRGTFLPATMSLFCVDGKGRLMPLAVQLGQTPDAGPIFTPRDPPWLWLLVKMFVQSADAAFHEAGSHLLRTHLISEPFVLATARHLSDSHPLHELLAPHLEHTLAINYAARTQLLVPMGPIDLTMSAAYAGTVEIVKRAWAGWRFDAFDLRRDLAERGVDDTEALPGYHYRDDSLEVLKAIEEYVQGIVALDYRSDDDVRGDTELQRWAIELADPGAGGIPGLPGGGTLGTRAQLVEIVSELIHTCTAEHSSVNNGQYDYFGYPPNAPGTISMEPPRTKDELSESALVKALPKGPVATQQIAMVHMLSLATDAPLGTFPAQHFDGRPEAQECARRFASRLSGISDDIQKRNAGLAVPYTYLDPRQIARSIAI